MNCRFSPRNVVSNQHGSTLVLVLAISSVLAVLFGYLADKISLQKKAAGDLTANTSYSVAIQSVTDFARAALKQKWCFTEGSRPTSLDDPANCAGNYTHGQSTYRLMLPPKYALKLAELKKMHGTTVMTETYPASCNGSTFDVHVCARDMLLSSFTLEGEVGNLGNTALEKIINSARGTRDVKYVTITYEKIQDYNLPSSGDEVYIRITTALRDSTRAVIRNGSAFASEIETLYVAPRENNYFSLILGRNFYIGRSGWPNGGAPHPGDAYSPGSNNFGSVGVAFHSPVFVNENIILPPVNPFHKYALTFYDTVVIGKGFIGTENGGGVLSGYQHATALGDEKSWQQTTLLGGFIKGFEIDGGVDVGLSVLGGSTGATAAQSALTNVCINRIREKENPSATFDAQLYARVLPSSNPANRKYRFSFLQRNWSTTPPIQKLFYPQFVQNGATENSMYLKDRGFFIGKYLHDQIGKVQSGDITNAISAEVVYPSPDDFYPLTTTTTPTVSFTAEIGWKNKIRTSIPLPDEYNGQPGEIAITLRPNSGDMTTAAVVRIKVSNFKIGGDVQPHFRDVQIKLEDEANLVDASGETWPIEFIRIRAMDSTCGVGGLRAGECMVLPQGSGTIKDVYIRRFTGFPNEPVKCHWDWLYYLQGLTSSVQCDDSSTNWTSIIIPPGLQFPSETVNYQSYFDQCATAASTNLGSASSSVIEQAYADNTYQGWEFQHKLSDNVTMTFSNVNQTTSTASGIYNLCIVPSTVHRVVGHYMCRNLHIISRAQPLEMIGTFIVFGELIIAPDAMENGIDWYSMHHPHAVQVLRDTQILKPADPAKTCNTLSKPHWHPDPGISALADRLNCSPLATLRGGTPEKFPFRWTSVTADCVRFPSTSTDTTCLKKIRNYFYQSLERRYVQ